MIANRSWIVGVAGLIGAFTSVAVGAQGFKSFLGGTDEVILVRRRPPAVYLMGTAITVKVTSQVPEGQQLAERIASALETELLRQDSRLKPSKDSPESVIACTITKVETAERMTSRVLTESRHVRDDQVWNAKTQKNETKAVYQDVQVTHNYKVVTGAISLSYQARDERSKTPLDSDNVNPTFSREYENGDGAPTASGVYDVLIQQALASIVPRLVPTKESLSVLLGKDKRLDESNKLAQAGLWSKALEKLSVMPPYAKIKDDAYRQYNIGVANEAMAYEADDVAVAEKLLEQAAIQYGKALEMNPSEKYFRDPQTRINGGIAAYKKLEEQQATYAQLQAGQAKQAESERQARLVESEGAKALNSKVSAGAVPHAFGNDDVIALVKSGLDDSNLLAAISAEKSVQFDLSAQGLKALLDGKVSNRVIAAMRTRQAGGLKKPHAAPAKPGASAVKPGTPDKAAPLAQKKPGGEEHRP